MKIARTLPGLLAGATLALTLLPAAGAHARVADAAAPRAGSYYLALGDSLTVGYQPDPSVAWTRGWVNRFHDALVRKGEIALANFGHRGECSDTFIKGGMAADCPTKLVDSPSQLAEATGLIRDHPGQVRVITVEIGGNDLNGNKQLFFNSTPAQQRAILGKIFPAMAHNWGTIFATLRQTCPSCEIIALNQYNPFPTGALKVDVAPLFTTYTGLLRQASGPARVQIADVYTPFVGKELRYTWIAHGDIHANNAGYAAMAAAVERVAGVYAAPAH